MDPNCASYDDAGQICKNECHQRSYSYYYCDTPDGSWDYCSKVPGEDRYGRKCTEPCGKLKHKGSTYCNLATGSWDYCGTTKSFQKAQREKELEVIKKCDPTLKWKLVAHGDNRNGLTSTTYSFRETIGLQNRTPNEKQIQSQAQRRLTRRSELNRNQELISQE